jgi:hypothetical protein
MKPELLFKVEVPDYRGPLAEVFTIIDYPPMGVLPDVDVCRCARVLVTTGFTGASRSDVEALPALSLICCVGTGYEMSTSSPRANAASLWSMAPVPTPVRSPTMPSLCCWP